MMIQTELFEFHVEILSLWSLMKMEKFGLLEKGLTDDLDMEMIKILMSQKL